MKLKLKHKDVQLPTYATSGAGCFDIRADNCKHLGTSDGETWYTAIGMNDTLVFETGLFFEVPQGKVLLVFSRSGHGFKQGINLVNCVGVIDSDYRGEVAVGLKNNSALRFDVNVGDRIAQALILPVKQVVFEDVQELSTTERGVAGFGSTGF